jgi:hypothetical protein
MDINRLSEDRKLLAQPESNTNIDQIVTHGVVMGGTDIYTYVPDEAFNEESSRHSSTSLKRRSSDNSQHASSQRKSISSKPKSNSTVSQTPTSTAPVAMPIHPRQNASQLHWTGLPLQPPNMHQGGIMLQQHNVFSGAPPGFVPMNPVPDNFQAGGLGFQLHMAGPEYPGGAVAVGSDSMDLDSMTANLWWDRLFDLIPSEQYGWDPFRGYQAADGSGYYRP